MEELVSILKYHLSLGCVTQRRGARVNSRRPMERKNEITTHPMSDSPIQITIQNGEKLPVTRKVNHNRFLMCALQIAYHLHLNPKVVMKLSTLMVSRFHMARFLNTS